MLSERKIQLEKEMQVGPRAALQLFRNSAARRKQQLFGGDRCSSSETPQSCCTISSSTLLGRVKQLHRGDAPALCHMPQCQHCCASARLYYESFVA